MVEFDGDDEQVGKDVAMHVAAMKPVALSSADVPAELIEKERSVAAEGRRRRARPKPRQAAQSPRSSPRWSKAAVQKYLKEVSLLNQPFVKNDKQTVEQMLKAANTTVKGFTLYVVGEGIEKKAGRLRRRSGGAGGAAQA